ncbi:MAG: hypothetical protein LQ345_005360 [Seirophora villosa]|nr:MAG: hypothetical protein LQ345_005360 [Seirophora villosa]
MSLESGRSLPLPVEPRCIAAVPEMHTAWRALIQLGNEVQTGSSTVQRNGGPMLLAFKYLSKTIKPRWIREDKATRKELSKASAALLAAVQWLQPQVMSYIKGHTSLSFTVQVAQAELDELSKPNASGTAIMKHQLARVEHCRLLWTLIKMQSQQATPEEAIAANRIKGAFRKLDAVANRPLAEPLPRNEEFQPRREKMSQAGKRRTDSYAAVKDHLRLSDKDKKVLRPYFQGRAPTEGPVASPASLPVTSIATLRGAEWVDDRVVDSYAALVCHHGNGHFETANADTNSIELEGSPKYHAWPLHLFEGLDTAMAWPPPRYPNARVESIKHHFFPFLVSESHWVMVHLWLDRTTWVVDFYSSAQGYERAAEEKWAGMAAELKTLSGKALNVTRQHFSIPFDQPQQLNSNDCGVLILCVARWIMEGWPLDTLWSSDCFQYRELMMVELEKWRLH